MDKIPQPKSNFSKPHTAMVIRITINKSTGVMLGLILAFILIATWMPGYSKELRVFAQEQLNASSPQAVEAFSSTGTISFQGELRDQATGATLPDGEYKMRFAIYDAVFIHRKCFRTLIEIWTIRARITNRQRNFFVHRYNSSESSIDLT